MAAFYGRLGVSKQTIYDWFKSENPTQAALGAVLSAYPEVNVEWLKSGRGDMLLPGQSDGDRGEPPQIRTVSSPEPSGSLLAIPTTPAGHGASRTGRINDGPSEPTLIPEAQLRLMTGGHIPRYADGRPRLTLSHAVGDSGAPYIPDGHPILYEPEAEFVDGARYAIWIGEVEGDVVKRIELGPGKSVTLKSDNPNVSPRTLYPTDDPEIWKDKDGKTLRLRVQGRIRFPFDTGPAVFGQLAEFARSLLRS